MGKFSISSIESPLIYSRPLSKCISQDVFLKLENVQPTNSFKIRGMSRVCKQKAEEGFKGFVTFSGGNAGIALAYAANEMGMQCHIILPSFVSPRVMGRMAEDGYSSIVGEIKSQLEGKIPSCIILSVGGGGMLMGLTKGFEKHGWETVPILAMETEGAHSFNKSIKAGAVVENVMTSIAKTLGAPSVAPKLMEILPKFDIISNVQSDAAAVEACLRFSDDHAFCVEPACGVSLSAVYQGILHEIFTSNGHELGQGPVVVLVCGGCDSSVKILKDYAEKLGIDIV
ncbi:Serine dehydratase-like [Folsomia candida]|uniref:L-serine ammonia-lyase n=1 Tax=Folsomia candida TaxID=158441 RepID=A0A226E0C1_FOLCA|nr:Serine dehydratase-like [Folsomia candida]